jgi:hypothetical protein
MTASKSKPSVVEVVDTIEAGTRDGVSDEAIVAKLEMMGLCREHGEDALETVRSGFGRAQLYAMGMRPKQFSGDFEADPLFLEAVKRAGGMRGGEVAKTRPWWKFW